MKRRRSDTDIMIDVLEEAARRSFAPDEPPVLRQYGPEELPIVIDLIDSDKVRGDTAHTDGGLTVTLDGITLKGRQLRDELISKRDAKSYSARLKNFGWVALGWIGGLLTKGATALIEHLLK